MDTDRANLIYKIIGIVGLAGLLLLTIHLGKRAPANPPALPSTTEPHASHDSLLPESHTKASGSVANGVREVAYEAFQYGFAPAPLIVNANERIRLHVKSRDVEHGMMIPEIDFNTAMPTDKAKTVQFAAPKAPGKYPILCSVYCGSEHGEMKGTLLVLP